MKTRYLSQAKINFLGKHSSVYQICTEGKIAFIHELFGKEVAVTGAAGSGDAMNYAAVYCMEVVQLDKYKGELEPLAYGPHFIEVDKGNRERCYNGMTALFKKTPYVFIGKKMTFEVSNAAHRRATARRLNKKMPLFAFAEMVEMEGKEYNMAQFIEDITVKQKSAPRKKRSMFVRFGRYHEMQRLISEYHQNHNQDLLYQAQRLRDNIKLPYTVLVRIGNESEYFNYPPTAGYNLIKRFTEAASTCQTWDEVRELESKMMEFAHTS